MPVGQPGMVVPGATINGACQCLCGPGSFPVAAAAMGQSPAMTTMMTVPTGGASAAAVGGGASGLMTAGLLGGPAPAAVPLPVAAPEAPKPSGGPLLTAGIVGGPAPAAVSRDSFLRFPISTE